MIVNFPQMPAKLRETYWVQVLEIIKQSFRQVNSRQYAQDRVYLQSPNGTVYAIEVDNSGVISATAYDGTSRD